MLISRFNTTMLIKDAAVNVVTYGAILVLVTMTKVGSMVLGRLVGSTNKEV